MSRKRISVSNASGNTGVLGRSMDIPLIPGDLLTFSMKYLVLDHEKYTVAGKDETYFNKLLVRLRDLSRSKVDTVKSDHSKALRSHAVDWEDTTETSFGIPDEEQLVDQPWQFSLTSNAHGRVVGFFIGTVFHIVWLDPEHRLYQSA